MRWVYDDGGRAAAGWKGHAGDCVTRAIAIASGRPYNEVYRRINAYAANERIRAGRRRSSARNGTHRRTYDRVLTDLGFTWTPTMHIGSGTTVHLRDGELPGGTIIVRLSRHLAAVVDGVIHDTGDPSRDGTRAVYGYWTRGSEMGG